MPYRYITLDYERYVERGDTVRFRAVFKDKEKVLTDPSNLLVKIYRGGVLVTSLTPVTLEAMGEAVEIRDLLIGAIAKAGRLPLVTTNVSHFSRISQLKVKTPEELLVELKRTGKLR